MIDVIVRSDLIAMKRQSWPMESQPGAASVMVLEESGLWIWIPVARTVGAPAASSSTACDGAMWDPTRLHGMFWRLTQ